ncbi:MAG: AI-2E family transporter [Terriglobales bacterium]
MLIFDARTARVLATILLYGLAIVFIYFAWRTLVTFLFAILFAYLLEPAVSGFQHRLRLTRGRAVLLLYLLLLVAIGLFFYFVGPRIVTQASHLSTELPSLTHRLVSGQIIQHVAQMRHWDPHIEQRIQQFFASHPRAVSGWLQTMLNGLGQFARNLIWIVLVPILAIFFLMSGGRFAQAILDQLARRRQRSFVRGMLQDVHDVLANYIRIQIILTVLTLLVYLAGFVAFRLPYAVALGITAGLLDFIPMVGPLIGAVMVIAIAFFAGYPHVVLVILFIGAWRVVMDYYLSPNMFGQRVQLHPLAVLFGVIAGAEVAGVIGVYLSVPIMAILRVVWIRWRTFEGEQSLILPPTAPPPESSP